MIEPGSGRGVGTPRGWTRGLIALGFLASAGLHFAATDTEARLIPEFLPWRRELVLISGAAEVAGALGLLYPPTRTAAAYGLVALLIAVFPANINHAVQNIQLGGFMDSRGYQWGRLPFQALFIWATLWSAKPASK
ncbi:MAG TPA: DoxX family protein [Thermomicrobiales bacterium]|jgi:uncharacterized membrane protein